MQRGYRLRGDRGSWTERSAGETREPGGKAERPGTAQRLNGDPQGPDPGNAGEGRPPRRPFLFYPGCRSFRVGETTITPKLHFWRNEWVRRGQLWRRRRAGPVSGSIAMLRGSSTRRTTWPACGGGFCGQSAMSALLVGGRLLVTDPLSARTRGRFPRLSGRKLCSEASALTATWARARWRCCADTRRIPAEEAPCRRGRARRCAG